MDLRKQLEQMDNRTLYLNLLLTQAILLIVGAIIYFFFLRHTMSIADIFHVQHLGRNILIGGLFAVVIVGIDILLMKGLPKDFFDDGGVNERLFRDVNAFQIALIALSVAVVEEWLFRAVVQNWLGVVWASLLFALIHYRYFRRWLYAVLILLISFGFGFLYQWTGSMWAVIFAHFLIDFILGLLIRYRWLGIHTGQDPPV